MQPTTQYRWRVIAAILICAAFLAALIVSQSAMAFGPGEPEDLKPPFKFQPDDSLSARSFEPFPTNATRLLTETFDSFTPSYSPVSTSTTTWYVFTDTGSANLYWNRVSPFASGTYANTAWAACGRCDGTPPSLDPDTDAYPPNMGTWLIYGPVNLSKYYDAELSFQYWIDADPAANGSGDYDFFGYGVSDDGSNFTGPIVTGNSGGWQTATLRLRDQAAQSGVYLGFFFHSNDGANPSRKGVFVDSVSLRGVPYLQVFLPEVAVNFSGGGTSPGNYLYNYTWPVGGENDPDLVTWGRTYTSTSGSTIIYKQELTSGNPGSGMDLFNTQPYLASMAGPNLTVSGNYEISAQFRVDKSKDNARYGIVFGADTSAFGRNGTQPTFNANLGYYRFALQFPSPPNANIPADFQLELCNTGDGTNCNKLVDRSDIPSGAAPTGSWDTLKVRRQGNQITIYLNNAQLASVSDGTYTGARKFGTFILASAQNNTSNPLKVSWDNFTVTQLP